jgi:plasmid stabilization system protein ParE
MATIAVSPAALSDIEQITSYLNAEAGATVALRYASAFDAAFDRLAQFPGVGPPRPRLG